ncbi:DeoR/GlpR transcriptional regulator [bacterium]|nr:DeoR/GlpR transcriptional regulator [bacterium]
MLHSERLARLKDLLAENQYLKIQQVENTLSVSRSTAVRDLDNLIELGLAQRTRGGVERITANMPTMPSDTNSLFNTVHVKEKQRISKKARSLLVPNSTLFIDGGTTTMQLCPLLKDSNYRIITNSLPMASYLVYHSNLEVIMTGGLLHRHGRITIGPHAVEVVKSVHADWFIASVGGIDAKGLTNTDLLTVEIERQMMQQSQRNMLLVDHTKFGKKALTFFTDFDSVDIIITDRQPAPEIADRLKQSDVQLEIAD